MKKLNFLFCLVFILYLNNGYAQKNYKPGWVVTNKNDTLHGSINLKSNRHNSRMIEFKISKDQSPQTYTPDDIKAFKIDNSKYYVSREIVLNNIRKKVFLEFLVQGIVDLYFLRENQMDYFFIRKDSTITLLLNTEKTLVTKYGDTYSGNSNQYIGILTYLFKDSPELKDKIANTGYKNNSLIKLTKDYHNSVCKDYACIDYTKKTKNSVAIEPNLGIINSWMGFKKSSYHTYNSQAAFGLNVRFSSNWSSNRWNVLLGLNYSNNDLVGKYTSSAFNETFQINAKYSILRIPISLQYLFPEKRIQPFISLSYNNILLLNQNSSIMRTETNYTYLVRSKLLNYEEAMSFGIGLKYNFKKSSYIFVKSEVEMRKSFSTDDILNSIFVNSWIINVGYGFNLF
jgi:hypothetical protein